MNPAKRLYYIVAFFLIVCLIIFTPFHRIATNQLADNPKGCRYYVTLLSILANSQGIASDDANVRFIKNRLLQFEKDMKHPRKLPDVVNEYKDKYHTVLKQYGVKSIKSVKANDTIMAIAGKSYDFVDGYYLDERLYCINPLYFQLSTHSRRILQYNFGGLYYQIPDRYARTLVAFPNDSQLGVFSGFLVNNQTTELETQFLTGMPMLTALYVLPKYDFSKIGSYSALVPWGYFSIESITDPLTRRVLNISGIDIFTVLRSYMTAKHIKEFTGAVPIQSVIRPMFGGDAQSFINEQSYGLAYLANHVVYKNSQEIDPYEKSIKNYFSVQGLRDPAIFTQATHFLYQQLMGLKSKRDIILEASVPSSLKTTNFNEPAGMVRVQGMVGPRALFDTHCQRDECTFVFNSSIAPGWYAYVNGEPSVINRANFAFMATTVPKGNSKVWFIYEPLSEVISYFISIISLIWFFRLGYMKQRKVHHE